MRRFFVLFGVAILTGCAGTLPAAAPVAPSGVRFERPIASNDPGQVAGTAAAAAALSALNEIKQYAPWERHRAEARGRRDAVAANPHFRCANSYGERDLVVATSTRTATDACEQMNGPGCSCLPID